MNGRVAVDPAFETALDYISDRQRSAELITMSFAQLRHCLTLFARTRSGGPRPDGNEAPYGRARLRATARRRSSQGHDGARFTLSRRTLTGRLPFAVD